MKCKFKPFDRVRCIDVRPNAAGEVPSITMGKTYVVLRTFDVSPFDNAKTPSVEIINDDGWKCTLGHDRWEKI